MIVVPVNSGQDVYEFLSETSFTPDKVAVNILNGLVCLCQSDGRSTGFAFYKPKAGRF